MAGKNDGKLSFKYGSTHTIGDCEYICYQEFGGYDLIKVKSKLSIYKKKILQKSTVTEGTYSLDPDKCKLLFGFQGKERKKESKRER